MIRFVTGTDTGVGKTVVSAWLAARARLAGQTVRYVKPLQTGVGPGAPGGDAAFVAAAAGIEVHELERFSEPLAPAIAAERAGARIDFDALVERTRALADGCDLLLVEGAGGLLVPIDAEHTMADLARALEASVVLVARPGLGTLNHTALTLEAARARGLSVALLVLSGWPPQPSVTETTNLARLRAHGIAIELVPAVKGLSVEAVADGTFAPAAIAAPS
jgi:dethiobiotin synthase